MNIKDIKNLKVGDVVQAFEPDEVKSAGDIKSSNAHAKLPKPTHDPYAGPHILYGFELEDPNLTIPLPSESRGKLH
jgi:hypothetical protein